MHPMKCLLLAILLLVAGCAGAAPHAETPPLIPGDASAPSQITPAESMAIAQRLATHAWRPFATNILHGKDKAGILVNTPDIGHEPAATAQRVVDSGRSQHRHSLQMGRLR